MLFALCFKRLALPYKRGVRSQIVQPHLPDLAQHSPDRSGRIFLHMNPAPTPVEGLKRNTQAPHLLQFDFICNLK
jgi:hypothetical protein